MTEPLTNEPEIEQASNDITSAAIGQLARRVLTGILLVALIGVFCVVDLVTPMNMYGTDASWLQGLLFGLCIGQVNLIAVWASLAPGNIVIRIFWSLLLTMATWYALIAGTWFTPYPHMKRQDAILLIAILLLGVAILQVPLWIAKKRFRWRLTRGTGDANALLQEDRQFHLQHLMIATFLLSVALSPLREVLPPEDRDTFHFHGDMFALLGAVIACNLLVTIPCVWWAFASRTSLVPLMLGWLVYCAVLTAVEFGSICAMLGPPGRDVLQVGVTFYVLNVAQCAAVLVALGILRTVGFRLVRAPKHHLVATIVPCDLAGNVNSHTQRAVLPNPPSRGA